MCGPTPIETTEHIVLNYTTATLSVKQSQNFLVIRGDFTSITKS